jgi:hypothetical protein
VDRRDLPLESQLTYTTPLVLAAEFALDDGFAAGAL